MTFEKDAEDAGLQTPSIHVLRAQLADKRIKRFKLMYKANGLLTEMGKLVDQIADLPCDTDRDAHELLVHLGFAHNIDVDREQRSDLAFLKELHESAIGEKSE